MPKAPKVGSTLYEQQRRRIAALAEREEIRNRKQQGELVSRAAAEAAWFQQGRQIRDALQNIASRIAGLVAAEKSQEKCFAIIAKEVNQVLEMLTPPTTTGGPR